MSDEIRSFWDIEEPETPGEMEFLPSLPSPWQTKDANKPTGKKSRLSRGKDKNKGVAKLLKLLRHNDKHQRRDAARTLGSLKIAEAVPPLIDAFRDPSFFVQREAAIALGNIGDARAIKPIIEFLKKYDDQYFRESLLTITGKLNQQDSHSYCMACFSRSEQYSVWLPETQAISYYACRICHGNRKMKQEVEKVTLILDHSFSQPFTFKKKHLIIDWFQLKRPLDCDEISILDARDHEVEELVMKFRNDMDTYRGKALKDIPVLLSPQLNLSKAKQNLLRDTFLVKGE